MFNNTYFVPKGNHFIFDAIIFCEMGGRSIDKQIRANSFEEAVELFTTTMLKPGQVGTLEGKAMVGKMPFKYNRRPKFNSRVIVRKGGRNV